MRNNGSKVIRINSEIADAIESLADFFHISTAEASCVFLTLETHRKGVFSKTIKEAKISYKRRKVLQKIDKYKVKL